MADRMTDLERSNIQEELRKLKGWNEGGKNDSRIRFLEMRLTRDREANRRDERKGRHRRVR